jgi:hypothetical protein
MGCCGLRLSRASLAWRISSTPAISAARMFLPRFAGLRPSLRSEENVDTGDWAKEYPDTQVVRLGERSFYVLHDLQELQIDQPSVELTSWFPATRIVRGSKRSTVCSI